MVTFAKKTHSWSLNILHLYEKTSRSRSSQPPNPEKKNKQQNSRNPASQNPIKPNQRNDQLENLVQQNPHLLPNPSSNIPNVTKALIPPLIPPHNTQSKPRTRNKDYKWIGLCIFKTSNQNPKIRFQWEDESKQAIRNWILPSWRIKSGCNPVVDADFRRPTASHLRRRTPHRENDRPWSETQRATLRGRPL